MNASAMFSLVALFVALGGGAFAASTAKKNTVTSKSIKNGQVRGIDVRDQSLTGADIADGSLGGAQIADKSIGPDDLSEATNPNCPSSMTRFGNTLCVDTTARPAAGYYGALTTCANANLRLPSMAEAWMARNLATPGETFWTGDSWREGPVALVDVAAAYERSLDAFRVHALAANLGVRCVTIPGVG